MIVTKERKCSSSSERVRAQARLKLEVGSYREGGVFQAGLRRPTLEDRSVDTL